MRSPADVGADLVAVVGAEGDLGIVVSGGGAAFLLRAVGDLGTSCLGWLSPLGWAQSISAFAGERCWVLFRVAKETDRLFVSKSS